MAETPPLTPTPLTAEQEAKLKEVVELGQSILELADLLRRRRDLVEAAHQEVKRRRTCRRRRCTAEPAAAESASVAGESQSGSRSHHGQEAQDGDDAQG